MKKNITKLLSQYYFKIGKLDYSKDILGKRRFYIIKIYYNVFLYEIDKKNKFVTTEQAARMKRKVILCYENYLSKLEKNQ